MSTCQRALKLAAHRRYKKITKFSNFVIIDGFSFQLACKKAQIGYVKARKLSITDPMMREARIFYLKKVGNEYHLKRFLEQVRAEEEYQESLVQQRLKKTS